jgi:DeoR/GlpR family transcriptional regulator of sugar metabolism
MNTDAKIEIAQKAATLIDEGISIFLDGGTTAMYLAKEMPDINCNVFTNGIAVAMSLAQKKNVNVTLVGGRLMKDNLSTSSPVATQYFSMTNFEIAIVSATAFTPENGFSCNDQMESELLQQVFKKARQVYMMLDTSKVGKINPYTFAQIDDIDVLITDGSIPKDVKDLFEQHNKVVM